jgi:signal transduction histidine kinase
MVLRLLPVLLIALVLIAWQYRWQSVVSFSLGVAALDLLLRARSLPLETRAFHAGLLVTIIQTICFLVVGYFISRLMARLQLQQDALAQANTQLVHYSNTLEELTISRERNRLARELHDTLAHTLSGLIVQLETVKAYWEVDDIAARAMLGHSLEATRAGLQETRRALKSLRASPLDDLGLMLALRRLAESAANRANLSLELVLPDQLPAITADIEQCIYRVGQEAIANAIHHAHARQLRVHLTCNGGGLELLVQDDGLGFDAQHVERPGHFGLPGMYERAQLAGGSLAVESKPGQGMLVRLAIPGVVA